MTNSSTAPAPSQVVVSGPQNQSNTGSSTSLAPKKVVSHRPSAFGVSCEGDMMAAPGSPLSPRVVTTVVTTPAPRPGTAARRLF